MSCGCRLKVDRALTPVLMILPFLKRVATLSQSPDLHWGETLHFSKENPDGRPCLKSARFRGPGGSSVGN